MFNFFRQKETQNPLSKVESHLNTMGFYLLPYGVAVAQLELESGYKEAEVASHIALTTLALDIKEAQNDITKLMAFVPHGMALLEILKNYKDNGWMNPNQWASDAKAIFNIIQVNESQMKWIEIILNDPIAGKERLASSKIN